MRPEVDCCWKCGYDLRNVPGDYVVCTECGEPNNRALASTEAEQWRRGWLKRGAAVGAAGLMSALIGLPAGMLLFALVLPAALLPGTLAVSWCTAGVGIYFTRQSVIPLHQRSHTAGRSLLIAALVGGACTLVALVAVLLGLYLVAMQL